MKMSMKNFTLVDVAMTKLAVLSATLFLVSAWDGFARWAQGVQWAWFLAVALALAIRPTMAAFAD